MALPRTPTNVLPLVNKALAVFQWKQDMATAEALCKEALDIDEECDVAVATAAQLSLQQGKIPEAIKWFEQSAKLARTEAEMTAAITCKNLFRPRHGKEADTCPSDEHASKAQMAFLQASTQILSARVIADQHSRSRTTHKWPNVSVNWRSKCKWSAVALEHHEEL